MELFSKGSDAVFKTKGCLGNNYSDSCINFQEQLDMHMESRSGGSEYGTSDVLGSFSWKSIVKCMFLYGYQRKYKINHCSYCHNNKFIKGKEKYNFQTCSSRFLTELGAYAEFQKLIMQKGKAINMNILIIFFMSLCTEI